MKFIYELFKPRLQDYFIRDFLQDIPDGITDPALIVAHDHARKLDKLTRYIAYEIHRKMAADTKHSERYQGMLIALKLFNAMLGKVPDELPTVAPRKEEKSTFTKALEGIEAFKAKLSTPAATDE